MTGQETLDDLRRLAGRAFADQPCNSVFDLNRRALRGDYDLNADATKLILGDGAGRTQRIAAVLVTIVMEEGVPHIVLTKRSDDMPTHAGQVSFPGGKMEPDDATPLDAALREAEEEIGLPRHLVEPIGYLDGYQTVTSFRIVPCVGLVRKPVAFVAELEEVAEIFTVPLAFLMDSQNHRLESREWRGAERFYYVMPYEDWYIWGATAGMLRNMYERLMTA